MRLLLVMSEGGTHLYSIPRTAYGVVPEEYAPSVLAVYDADEPASRKAVERWVSLFHDAYEDGLNDPPKKIYAKMGYEAGGEILQTIDFEDYLNHRWHSKSHAAPRRGKLYGTYSVSYCGALDAGKGRFTLSHGVIGGFNDLEGAVDFAARNAAPFFAREAIDGGVVSCPSHVSIRDELEGCMVTERKVSDAIEEVKWFRANYNVRPQPPCPVETFAEYIRRLERDGMRDLVYEAEIDALCRGIDDEEEEPAIKYEQISLF